MNIKCYLPVLLVFAFLYSHLNGQITAEPRAQGSKLELRVNALSLPMGNLNLGLRINSKHKLKPDFYASVQLPLLDTNSLRGENAFVGLLDYCFSAYGGFTLIKGGWGEKSTRLSFQLGAKAFHTGRFSWDNGGSDEDECGKSDQIRVTFGPRVLVSRLVPITKHFGIELFGGAGFRIGYRKDMEFQRGTALSGCHYTAPPLYPVGQWLEPRLCAVPTAHAGLSLVVW